MIDREKVLTWLEICGKNNDCSGCCPYSKNGFGEYGRCRESLMADAYDLLKEQEAVVHCGDCENFCFDNISPNAGRCMLTTKSHSKTWFCAHGKREDK